MDVGVLYSGGKDSTLVALLLEPFGEVTLLPCTFGITDDHDHARQAGQAVGFPVQVVTLDEEIAHEAVEQIITDGYPREGIQRVHEHALERAATLELDAIADGTRRDDRVPSVPRSLAQSIEDRHGVAHLAPLAGIGRDAIDAMVEQKLAIETGPSETVPKGDYETELRALIADEHGQETVTECFPAHTQSRVTGRR